MTRFSTFLLGSILFLTSSHGQNNSYSVERIGYEDGLSNQVIWSIIQDEKGFIWMGTEDGLNRFDGYSFKTFRHDLRNRNSLSDNFIYTLFEDSDGHIWIGTNSKGLSKFDPKTQEFMNIGNDEQDSSSFPGERVLCIAEDSTNVIWIGTQINGLTSFDKKRSRFTSYRYLFENEDKTIYDIEPDGNVVWVLTGNELIQFNPKTLQKNVFRPTSFHWSRNTDNIFNMILDGNGYLWIGAIEGLVRFDLNTSQFKLFVPEKMMNLERIVRSLNTNRNRITQILQMEDEELWLGTFYGILTFDTVNERMKLMDLSPRMDDRVNVWEEIIKLYKDDDGLVWVGTHSKGIQKIHKRKNNFLHYGNDQRPPFKIPASTIRSLTVDKKNNIWAGTSNNGLLKIDRTRNEVKVFSKLDPNSTLLSDAISCLYQGRNGKLWIGTWGSGLHYLETTESQEFKLISFNEKYNLDDRIQCIVEDPYDNLWIGSESGLYLYNPLSERIRLFTSTSDQGQRITPFGVQSNTITFDAFENIWVGTWGGLNKIVPRSTGVNYMDVDFDIYQYTEELVDKRITTINYDNGNPEQLYLGSYGGGFSIANFSQDHKISISSYLQSEGLPNDIVFGIQYDDFGSVWLSTNKGLSRFNLNTATFANFTTEDGIQDDQFFWGAVAKGHSKEMIFGGVNGFNVIHPENISIDSTTIRTVLVDLRLDNRSLGVGEEVGNRIILDQDISYIENLVLPPDQTMFSIEFGVLNYINSGSNTFAYKLEGFNEDWIYIDANNRIATFTNLDNGDYTFKLKGTNYDGVESPEINSLNIRIMSPWWSTMTSKIAGVFILLAIAYYIMEWRFRYNEAQNKKLSDIIHEKTTEINHQNRQILEKNEELEFLNKDLQNNLEEKNKVLRKLEKAQDQLIESEKMASLGVLTAGLAHELNNPLNIIGGVIEPVKQDLKELKDHLKESNESEVLLDEIQELLDHVADGAQKATQVIKNLLEISPKTNEDQFTKIDITELIGTTTLLIKKGNPNIQFEENLDNEIVIEGNPVEISQVLINMIKNGIDAIGSANKGSINISTKTKNDMVTIEISDNGSGIHESLKHQIFDPFFTTKEPGKGTGLGLYLSQSIIKKHSGQITVESKRGFGTTFKLHLPLSK